MNQYTNQLIALFQTTVIPKYAATMDATAVIDSLDGQPDTSVDKSAMPKIDQTTLSNLIAWGIPEVLAILKNNLSDPAKNSRFQTWKANRSTTSYQEIEILTLEPQAYQTLDELLEEETDAFVDSIKINVPGVRSRSVAYCDLSSLSHILRSVLFATAEQEGITIEALVERL